jgi:hypothetical protein
MWPRLLVPLDFDRKNKESFQLCNVIRVIGYGFAGPSNLASVIECVDFSDVRQTFYNVNNLTDLFTNVDTILSF